MGAFLCYVGAVPDTEAMHNGNATQTTLCICLIRAVAEVANVQSEEPGAGKPHAGICAGGAPKGASLPRWSNVYELSKL